MHKNRADPNTIQNKVIVGYQGWFTCAGDGPPVHQGHHGWLHWFDKPLTDGGRPNFDLFPDVIEYSNEELYPVPGLALNNQPAKLFSSRNPKTVQRHFNWMAQHGIDGAFLQRFATQCEADGNSYGATADLMRLRDEVLDRVREAAEKDNRIWAIMYDVSGVPADRIEHVLRVDWEHLMRDKRILESPYYLKERGMPVVAIWGLGFVEARHDPATVARIARNFKSVTPGGAYLWAGVPSQWRTLSGDMDPNPVFLDVFKNEFDALSPWTIGRYSKLEEIDNFCEARMKDDFKELKDLPRRVDYFPTIWPGGSSHNLSNGQRAINDAPRQGGKFFWRQLWNIKHLGARTAYIAMFDEYDEGTAVLPAIPLKRSLPTCTDPNRKFPFIALDADGVDNLHPDWYLRICGFAGEAMRDSRRVYEELPKKELDDYWASRPKYEDPMGAGGSGSGSGGGGGYAATASASVSGPTASGSNAQTPTNEAASTSAAPKPPVRKETGAWGAFGDDMGDDGPPPYTLEAEEPEEPTAASPAAAAPSTPAAAAVSPSNAQPAGSNASSNIQVSLPGPGVHRASSYAGSSNSASYNQNQGATGLGRATSYSPGGASASAASTRPTFAPPSMPPPGRTSSPLQPPVRPPVHPSSPLANSGSIGHSPASSISSLPYLPYNGRRPSMGTTPPVTSPNTGYFGGSISPAGYGTPPTAQNMPLPVNASPSHNSAPLAPGGFTVNINSPNTGIQPDAYQGSTSQPVQSPATGGTSYNPATMSWNPAASQAGGTPYNPAAMSWSPGNPQPTAPTSGATGYYAAGTHATYGAGNATGAQSSGVASNPVWSTSAQATPGWNNTPSAYPGSTGPSAPNPTPGFAPPMHAPPSMPPPGSSSYPGGPTGTASFPPQDWNSPYSASSSGSGPSTPFAGSSQPGPYNNNNNNAPALPPRPGQPGQPGGFVAPAQNTFLGGFVKQASGMVDRYAGENTRIQLEKGVISVAETGSSLLGKLTKKPK
ncbi:hypothetical protein M408DRAFT_62262 [Serendipita vermifera MAFF 305830]|uniref:Xylosidase/arabinosidase n=1 Tax=Serendipita vermifera MAFF 305830 TaxID=933852 RepID=A0A0C2XV09_SERVB|nr:hypothetical protein M408DRAFT_62262 [Serendipita vermifera MAFF 305830]